MKYLVATFNIETSADLMQACQDLLADGAAEAGFESFEETETGMEAYVQKDLFDKEVLDAYIADFPIMDTQITYDIEDAEDKDWNQEWEEQGFEPIFVGDQVVIYDAKHPELIRIQATVPTSSRSASRQSWPSEPATTRLPV